MLGVVNLTESFQSSIILGQFETFFYALLFVYGQSNYLEGFGMPLLQSF